MANDRTPSIVDSQKLEYGCSVIYVTFPSFASGSEDSHIPTLKLLLSHETLVGLLPSWYHVSAKAHVRGYCIMLPDGSLINGRLQLSCK